MHKFQIVMGKLLALAGVLGVIIFGFFVQIPFFRLPFLLAFVVLGVGLNWVIKASKADGRQTKRKREQFALMLARDRGGRVTVLELATASSWSFEECKELLDRLVIDDVADVNVTAAGEMVYAFRGLLSAEEKESAQDPLSFEVEE